MIPIVLFCGVTTIHHDGLARDVGRGIAGQKYGQPPEVTHLAVAANGGLLCMVPRKLRVIEDRCRELCGEKSRAKRIAGDAVGRPPLGNGPGQLQNAPLCRAVRSAVGKCTITLQRGDIDDPAPAARLHLRRERLGHEHWCGQVKIDLLQPCCHRDVLEWLAQIDTGGIDQDIGPAEAGLGGMPDFGNGVGAFANLKSLGIDYLKIDGNFIRNLARDPVSQAMVNAMVKLARTLEFRIIAEQVEDMTALEAARRMGIDFVQGYAIGRPEPLRKAALAAA